MVKITIHDDMLTAAIKDRAEKVLTAAASHVKSQARLTVPVDTGDLLNSIDTKHDYCHQFALRDYLAQRQREDQVQQGDAHP